MSSVRNQPQGFPAVPYTLDANGYEMHDFHADAATPPSTIPKYTPYLGLRSRLSQVWINRWTILLLLVIVRLLLAVGQINQDIADAKTQALSACTSVENVGSAMASMPHYLSQGVNALAADGITKAVEGLMSMILLTVTGVEEMVLFYINFLTSTYLCLITLVIGGSLEVAIEMIEKVGAFMNSTIKDITGDIATAETGFQNTLNSFLKALSVPASLFGASKTPPSIDLSSQISQLNSITIDPTTMDSDLNKLNSSIPTFADVQNFTNNVISFPFEEIKKLINQSLPAYTFDQSVFPVPEKKALTFCSDNSSINDFFAGLTKVVNDARIGILIVLAILAVLACIPMAYMEIRRWRTMQQRAQLVQKNSFDPVDVIYIASRPYTSTVGIKAASKLQSTKKQILTRWFVAYITTIPAFFVLSLGIAGLFSCLCQLIILRVVEKETPIIANEVGGFADQVVYALNNASESWANDANGVISSFNGKVNQDVFGWVNTSTTAVNDTLNAFTDEMNKVLNTTFGGTILYTPVTGLMNCLVGLKVAGIEKGLTWVHDNAHVTFPEFRADVFSLGAAASLTNSNQTDSFLSNPGGVTGNEITDAVVKIATKLQSGVRTEAIISACLVGLWLIVVLVGLGKVLLAIFTRDKTRAEGQPSYTGENRIPLSPRSQNRSAATFPEFGGPVSSIHPDHTADEWADVGLGEKTGAVGHRSVEASVKPGHARASSYGYLDEKS